MTNVVLLSSASGVGKTLLARNLFAPQLSGGQILSVQQSKEYSGTEAKALFLKILLAEHDWVVDVDAFATSSFLKLLGWMRCLRDEIDAWVIPFAGNEKQIKECQSTLNGLLSLQIDPDKIHVLVNQSHHCDPIAFDRPSFQEVWTSGAHVLLEAVIFCPVFDKLGSSYRSVFDVNDLEINFGTLKEVVKKSGDVETMRSAGSLMLMRGHAKSAVYNLRGVYNELSHRIAGGVET